MAGLRGPLDRREAIRLSTALANAVEPTWQKFSLAHCIEPCIDPIKVKSILTATRCLILDGCARAVPLDMRLASRAAMRH